jgi:hypothetical protein
MGGDSEMRRQVSTALCLAGFGIAAASALAIAQQNSASAAENQPVYSSIKELMDSIIDPSADGLWNAVGTVVDKDAGVQEAIPRTEEEWHDVRRAAVRIIEGANLLMMPGREAAPAGTKSETPGVELEPAEIAALIGNDRRSFDGFARALQALGVEALGAGDAKNADLLLDVGGRMENVCEGCHQTFWYPNAATPQPRGQ